MNFTGESRLYIKHHIPSNETQQPSTLPHWKDPVTPIAKL